MCVSHTASLLQKEEDQKIRASKEARANWLSLKMAARLAALQVLSFLALLVQSQFTCFTGARTGCRSRWPRGWLRCRYSIYLLY